MNIFLMLFAVIFITGYYLLDSPSQNIARHHLENAVRKTELQDIADCLAKTHAAALKDQEIPECSAQMEILTGTLCTTDKQAVVDCASDSKARRPAFSYVITTAPALPTDATNDILEVLGASYPNTSNFGIFTENYILSADGARRELSKAMIKEANFQQGQLIYLTQYAIRFDAAAPVKTAKGNIVCAPNEIKVMKAGRWTCAAQNQKLVCTGDTIWSTDKLACVIDPKKRPLCNGNQTAVESGDIWECMDPLPARECPKGMTARLNYGALEWECIADARATPSKCKSATAAGIYGAVGTTLRRPVSNCTDCEEMITDEISCETKCVASPSKLNDKKCYPAAISECTGSHKAFYFGTNRKFNCLDCGDNEIDIARSNPPLTAVCK